MKDLLIFLLLTGIGIVFGHAIGINPIMLPHFDIAASSALAVGLYVAVSGIDIPSLGRYKKTALLIITAGVPLQIVVTGLLMYLIYPHPISFLVAVAIDQIDPISVSTLLNNKLGMSKSAKSLLHVWASFDDPMTVLFGFAVLLPLLTGVRIATIGMFMTMLVMSLVPAIGLYILYRKGLLDDASICRAVVIASLAYTAFYQAFLYGALIGLFLRPFDSRVLSRATTWMYYAVIVIVGASLVFYGVDIRLGVLLAVMEFFVVQPLSAILLVKGTTNDIFRLAFAQQNGLTTILMGLVFQALGYNVLPILLPAIVCINAFNLFINGIYNLKEQRGYIITSSSLSHAKKDSRLMQIH